jgi:16S rRNA processing protein RimM
VKSFTEPAEAIAGYEGAVQDADGNKVPLKVTGAAKGQLIASIEGISDRNQAEALMKRELFVPRDMLPEPEAGEFYYEDLVDMDVRDEQGGTVGKVISVDNYGAGDVVEILLAKETKSQMFSFEEKTFPEVNLEAGYVVIILPETISAQE